ncbi:hypothetical protein [Brevundimonas sp.]|uniref:hypothetical protein n=1 Tax=Brevundimonas sp. TaxID=1871086 RepID=UPI0025D0BF7A|nr:hypothetical protein [Brevundimonas sp.]
MLRNLAFAAALLAATPAFVQAQDTVLGRVTAYNRAELRAFDSDGRPLGQPIRSRDLPANAPIVALRPGGGVGIRHGGQIIFLRGIDVEFQLNESGSAQCLAASGATRESGAISTGTYAGGGSSRDCRLGGS